MIGTFGRGFEIMFMLMFLLVFLLVLGIIIAGLVRNIGQWNENNHSPRLTVQAAVVSKRADVSRHHHHSDAGAAGHTTTSTTYYATFQVSPSGDRMELQMSGQEYGLLAEGDQGELTFQGTRYLGFQRM